MKRKNYKLQAAAIITGTVLAISTGIAAWAAETETEAAPVPGSEPWFQVEVNAEIPSPEDDDDTIVFGVVPTPHGEVAEAIKEKLSDAGWKLAMPLSQVFE